MNSKLKSIDVKSNVDSVVMLENVRIGLMEAKHRKKCNSINCNFDYHAYVFGQSPFHVPKPLEIALASNTKFGHYSAAEGITE